MSRTLKFNIDDFTESPLIDIFLKLLLLIFSSCNTSTWLLIFTINISSEFSLKLLIKSSLLFSVITIDFEYITIKYATNNI